MATYPLRPLSVGEILDAAFTLFRRHFRVLLAGAALCQGIPLLLVFYAEAAGRAESGLAVIGNLLSWPGYLLVTGGTVRVISEAYLGGAPTLGDAMRFAGAKLWRIFVAGLAVGIVTLVATVAFIIPGIVVYCGLSLVTQIVVLEPLRSATDALGRSWQLTKGFKGKVLGLWVLVIAIWTAALFAVSFALGVLLALLPVGDPPGEVAGMVVAGFLVLFLYPFTSCVFTLLYYDLRVRKEAFDLEVLSREMGVAPAGG